MFHFFILSKTYHVYAERFLSNCYNCIKFVQDFLGLYMFVKKIKLLKLWSFLAKNFGRNVKTTATGPEKDEGRKNETN